MERKIMGKPPTTGTLHSLPYTGVVHISVFPTGVFPTGMFHGVFQGGTENV